jgi:hypothetical protein
MSHKTFTVTEAEAIAQEIGIKLDQVEFDINDFTLGLNVELEHGSGDPETNVTNDDPILTGKIAWAHLKESGDYSRRLAKMEEEMDEGKPF